MLGSEHPGSQMLHRNDFSDTVSGEKCQSWKDLSKGGLLLLLLFNTKKKSPGSYTKELITAQYFHKNCKQALADCWEKQFKEGGCV